MSIGRGSKSLVVPEGWEYVKLEEIADRATGHTPDKQIPSYWDGGIKWVSLADSNKLDRPFIFETDKEISEEGIRKSSARLLPAGTVVLLRDAAVGRSTILATSMAVSQHFVAWICGDRVNNRFLYYYLQFQKHYFERMAVGSTIVTIGMGLFRKLMIPLPSRSEQGQIAFTLTKWDHAIDLVENLIVVKKKRRTWLMQQLLTGKRRLSGFNGAWREVEIGNLFREVNRPVEWDDDDLYALISVRRRSGGLFHRDSLYGRQILTKNLKTVHTGDFLISKMQVLHGATGMVTPEFDGMKVSGSYISMIPRKPVRISTEFFSYFSQMPSFYHLTFLASFGVHIEKMTFDVTWFMKSKVSIPPSVEEQDAIVKHLKSADRELDLLNAHLDALREQKKGLMQQLLTGKVRVKV